MFVFFKIVLRSVVSDKTLLFMNEYFYTLLFLCSVNFFFIDLRFEKQGNFIVDFRDEYTITKKKKKKN